MAGLFGISLDLDVENALPAPAGELVAAEGLAGPDQAKLVRAGKDGKPLTDGVFPEAKEFLAGFWIVDVDSPERAYELAAEVSAAPGPGGAPLYLALERLEALDADERLAGHHRLDAVCAHLLEQAGDREGAIAHYRAAAGRTTSLPERNYLMTRAARLSDGDG